MPILTKSGRVVIAESVAARPLYFAWGTADGTWVAPPAENSSATALIAEVGRRLIVDKSYVTPDPVGEIVMPSGKYTASPVPTKYLYIKALFEYEDAPVAVIREVAVFAGSTVVSGLPAGQRYFAPAEVATPGRMLHLENLTPIIRSPTARENFEVVIEF